MSEPQAVLQQELRLALIGKTGGGKSSLGNVLLQHEAFEVGDNPQIAHTKDCQRCRRIVRGRLLTVVDSPGTIDTLDAVDRQCYDPRREIPKIISFCPNGFHAYLLVFRLDVPVTQEELQAIEQLKELLGDFFYQYTIVVFTHGDKCKNDEEEFKKSVEDIKKSNYFMRALLNNCRGGIVMVDCSTAAQQQVQEQQVQKLLQLVEAMPGDDLFTEATAQQAIGMRSPEQQRFWEAARSQRLNLLFVGDAGSGKSSVAKAVMEADEFPLSAPNAECSENFCVKDRFFRGRMVNVRELCGKDRQQIRDSLKQFSNERVHAVLLVIRIDCDVSEGTREAIQNLRYMFEDSLSRILIVVLTHGDHVGNDANRMLDWISRMTGQHNEMRDIMNMCGQRFALMDFSRGRSWQQMYDQVGLVWRIILGFQLEGVGRGIRESSKSLCPTM